MGRQPGKVLKGYQLLILMSHIATQLIDLTLYGIFERPMMKDFLNLNFENHC